MIQKFEVIINVSNNDIEDVRKKLECKIANWLDNISFSTGKNEICKNVIIISNSKPKKS